MMQIKVKDKAQIKLVERRHKIEHLVKHLHHPYHSLVVHIKERLLITRTLLVIIMV